MPAGSLTCAGRVGSSRRRALRYGRWAAAFPCFSTGGGGVWHLLATPSAGAGSATKPLGQRVRPRSRHAPDAARSPHEGARRPPGTAATGRCQPGAERAVTAAAASRARGVRAVTAAAASRARGVRAAVVRAGVLLTAAPRSGRVFAAGSGQPAARSALARGAQPLPSALARPAATDAGAHAAVTPALRRAP